MGLRSSSGHSRLAFTSLQRAVPSAAEARRAGWAPACAVSALRFLPHSLQLPWSPLSSMRTCSQARGLLPSRLEVPWTQCTACPALVTEHHVHGPGPALGIQIQTNRTKLPFSGLSFRWGKGR